MIRKFLCACLAGPLLFLAPATSTAEGIKVVYHLNDEQSATLAMHNMMNHLAADAGAKIVMVALARGVKVFTFGAQDAGGKPFEDWVDALSVKGVEFRLCQNSMNAMNLTAKDLIDKVTVVPSGVAEIARLQAREGFVYIKP
ncbi:MAG: DsrE family protein [Burkholderiales bacterium]